MIELATVPATFTSPPDLSTPLDVLRPQMRTLIEGTANYNFFAQRLDWLTSTYTDPTLDDFRNVVSCISTTFRVLKVNSFFREEQEINETHFTSTLFVEQAVRPPKVRLVVEAASQAIFLHSNLKRKCESGQEGMNCYEITFKKAVRSVEQELKEAMEKYDPKNDRRLMVGLSPENTSSESED